jgi:signal transduction histidine kinase
VIANLLDNELKHLPAACTVFLSLAIGDDYATLVVEDNGPGFAPEIALDVFDQHVKGRQSTGRGLGLAFVQAVVRAHGGTVAAENRPESGARLVLTWPREAQAKVEADQHVEFA